MSLLELSGVTKRYRERTREQVVLDDVTLRVGGGELVMVYGEHHSGRTTLLRIAGGIEPPNAGTVTFDGNDLASGAEALLGVRIGYVQRTLRSVEHDGVLEQVIAPLLARGVPLPDAYLHGRGALARAGAERLSELRFSELAGADVVRVALARTLALSPALVLVDEPTTSVPLREREEILSLLRELTLAGTAVLATTGEPGELAGAHRALSLSEGRLLGPAEGELAPVVALRRSGM